MDNSNVEIFINTIKDLKEPLGTPYTPIILGDNETNDSTALRDNTSDNISYINNALCEFTGMYWVWKNHEMKDYVGFCQYRRILDPKMFTTLHIGDLIDKYGIIIANRLSLGGNVAQQYNYFHNIKDLALVEECIKETHPDYIPSYSSFVSDNYLYTNNCFITSKEKFSEYAQFIWDVISRFMEKANIKTYEDCVKRVEENKEDYLKDLKDFPQNGTVEYQARFLAYLTERLTCLFVRHNFMNPCLTQTIMTEKKYITE